MTLGNLLGKRVIAEEPSIGSAGTSPAAMAEPASPLAPALPSLTALRAELEDLKLKELGWASRQALEDEYESQVSNRCLVGIVAPRRTVVRAAETDSLVSDGAGTVKHGNNDDLTLPGYSLAPAAIGLTCTVCGSGTALAVTPGWDRYARGRSETVTAPSGNSKMVWKRGPRGGKPLSAPLTEGDIAAKPAGPARLRVRKCRCYTS